VNDCRRSCAALLLLLAVLLSASLTSASSAAASASYTGVFFVDATHGWFTGGGPGSQLAVWKTNDGGKTLRRQASHAAAGGGFGRLAFSRADLGLWSDDTGIRRTTDGGVAWERASWPEAAIPGPMEFAGSSVVWASARYSSDGSGGEVARSTDGGATWTVLRATEAHGPTTYGDLSCPSPERCYVVGTGDLHGLWWTADAGSTWARRPLPAGAWLLDFPAELTGWALGGRGAIAKTTNGGATWKRQASGTSQSFTDACFTSPRRGYAVTDRGLILGTNDGGSHWRRQASFGNTYLDDVFFLDSAHGWAVGITGLKLRTTDGGHTWRRL
jgi:photosystem II stability/assembly factor-like uncharacterized protein